MWDALGEGGSIEQCGWLRDRWGLCWQIVPKCLKELMSGPDTEKTKRVTQAMLKMIKLDIAGLEAAARGDAVSSAQRAVNHGYSIATVHYESIEG